MSTAYIHNYEHLAHELDKLDQLISHRAAALRQRRQSMPEDARNKLYISYEEFDWLLTDLSALPPLVERRKQIESLHDEINRRSKISVAHGIFLPMAHLERLFTLSPFELQAIIICLAPELRPKYHTLYAYLQDDMTRQKPRIDLILDLLCFSEPDRWQARTYFSDDAPLFRYGLLRYLDDQQDLQLDPRILAYILGSNRIDERLTPVCRVLEPLQDMGQVFIDSQLKTRITRLVEQYGSSGKLTLYLQGQQGAGKRDLARGICGQLGCPLLYLDASAPDAEALLQTVFRETLLLQAALYIDHADSHDERFARRLEILVMEYGGLVILAGEKAWMSKFDQLAFQSVHLPAADGSLRQAAWENALQGSFPKNDVIAYSAQLAHQFRLTPGQIKAALQSAAHSSMMSNRAITINDLHAACRNQSNQKLAEIALKITPRCHWDDIILPESTLWQLREICNHVKYRHRIFSEWGFDAKLTHGKGLSVLFFGPPGTGKTLAAEVIAAELQLDLYKVDLSGVVSKYIGETEKNLARIFDEAESSNAILFFDEADALFGKRTGIADAHDRYANIETSYLLQKMEEYEGIAILATNLRENMDESFVRRLRFIIEFPFPDAINRAEIWKAQFPSQVPLGDIDYEFLAEQFPVAGGHIKNIVLNAAFLAAQDGGRIQMEHLLDGTRQEFEKIGKLWNEGMVWAK